MIDVITNTAYIGLGGNLGDRAKTIIKALTMLDNVPGVTVGLVSQMIETEPVGGPSGQGNYLNNAAQLHCRIIAEQLLYAKSGRPAGTGASAEVGPADD